MEKKSGTTENANGTIACYNLLILFVNNTKLL